MPPRDRTRPAINCGVTGDLAFFWPVFAVQWKHLYRAVDKAGETVDFLLSGRGDLAAARRKLERAINLHGLPEKIHPADLAILSLYATSKRKRFREYPTDLKPEAISIRTTL